MVTGAKSTPDIPVIHRRNSLPRIDWRVQVQVVAGRGPQGKPDGKSTSRRRSFERRPDPQGKGGPEKRLAGASREEKREAFGPNPLSSGRPAKRRRPRRNAVAKRTLVHRPWALSDADRTGQRICGSNREEASRRETEIRSSDRVDGTQGEYEEAATSSIRRTHRDRPGPQGLGRNLPGKASFAFG